MNKCEIREKVKRKIDSFRKHRESYKNRNLLVVKRSKNIVQALNLPKIINLNPQSAMNKLDELKINVWKNI